MTSKLLVILGPTSTGKTDLALFLAKKFNGELIACDSRQVYIGLDIGTGKLPSSNFNPPDGGQNSKLKKGNKFWELNGIKIWMYDMVDPKEQYSVADYVKEASRIIEEIRERGKLPIIVGGTGFYLKALLEGLSNLTIPMDPKLREKLDSLSLQELQTRLQELSTQKWEKMNSSDRQNPRRLIRAIELSANFPVKIATSLASLAPRNDNILKIGLTVSRNILYKRIDERVVSRINQGMIDEAEKLHKKGLSLKRMRQLGLEYGVLADYLEDKFKNSEELIKLLQGKIHGYARRQITWYKKEKDIIWFDITEEGFAEKIEKLVIKWYDILKYAAKS